MSADEVTFKSEDGLSLEGLVDSPSNPTAAVVVCHPHPKLGGTMRAPLLAAVTAQLVDDNWASIRFNFRGVGASAGEAGTGLDEVADARGAVGYARARFPGLPVAIAGWSFGAAVAVRVAAVDPDLVALVGIAPAVRPRPGVTAGLPPPAETRLTVPARLIIGANDELVAPDDVRDWAASVGGIDVVVLRGANHFFWGKYEALASEITGFLDTTLHDA